MRHTYYPFGTLRTTEGTPLTSITDYTFAGQELDTSDSLIFYEARYYDPLLSRFISADTLVPGAGNPQSLNRYSYVINNPVKFVDPIGLAPSVSRRLRSE